ncbi:MAG: HupE/UreJ family protein [Rhizobiaceae bacterium]|nr:HupE/UreJ family protein [Rhizobiaceae bacterium]
METFLRAWRTVSQPFFLLRLALLVLCTASLAPSAKGHEIRPTIATLAIAPDGRFELALSLNLEALMAEIGPEHRDSSTSANASEYERLRALPPERLGAEYDDFAPGLRDGIRLETSDGARVALVPDFTEIGAVGDTGIQRTSHVVYSGRVPDGATALRWRFDASFGPSVIRARKEGGEIDFSDYLLDGAQSRDIPMEARAPETRLQVFLDYVAIGFEHIVPNGLDHMLFVIGLFLLSPRLKPLVAQATCFTLAHSVTLALGALGMVAISPSVVEPLIALSIVYVAAENIWTDRLGRWRYAVIFVFGLLHGLGFAGVLSEIGMTQGEFWTGLVAFNIGVELGQIAVIGACVLTLGLWFGQKPWYRRRITLPASALVAGAGSVWFFERVF